VTYPTPVPSAGVSGTRRTFGPFELDLRSGELRRDGIAVRLQPQPFRVLAMLVERPGDLVTREELKKALWGEDTYVDFERGLNFCINQVRAALGDSAAAPRFVQTLPRRGYRFIAGVATEDVPPQVSDEPSAHGPEHPSGHAAASGRAYPPGPAGAPWYVALAGVAFLLLLVAGATFLAGRTGGAGAARPPRAMIAVLPLEDMTGDPRPGWFADGLTEELIAQVGRISPSRLGVIARTSAMAYRGSGKSIGEIARELGVSHVLEGSLRREGARLRVTVQLVAAAGQSPIWSETYDRSAQGALTIQSEVAAQVARALAIELLDPPSPAAPAGTRDPEARDALLRGRHILTRGAPPDFSIALAHLEEATRHDPQYAAAHAAQAQAHHLSVMFGAAAPLDAYARARVAAREALRLDPNLADAHTAAGIVELWAEWNPSAAAQAFTRALAINPSDAAAHHDLAWALVAMQRFDEAVAHITKARELDPMSPRASTDTGWLFLQIRQPSEALRACRQTLAIDPGSIEAQHCLERAHLQRGEFTEAMAAAQAAADRRGEPLPASTREATPQQRLMDLWRTRLSRLQALAGGRIVSPYTVAMHHAVLGDHADALAALEAAHRGRSPAMVLLPTDPAFDGLRGDPRFARLVAAVRR
jgi:TolB-like protein/DNA-binding winged helix-turn-helix (wHTH) protein/Tfp pilus assembly protein PilF